LFKTQTHVALTPCVYCHGVLTRPIVRVEVTACAGQTYAIKQTLLSWICTCGLRRTPYQISVLLFSNIGIPGPSPSNRFFSHIATDSLSTLTPGPIVVDNVTRLIYCPLAVEGFARFRASSSATTFSLKASKSKETLPIGQ